MRRVQSLFKTMLMLIPMTAVPVMALFGIPQFFPVSASPFAGHGDTAVPGRVLERRVGQSDALQIRDVSTELAASFDLFEPYDARSRTERSDTADMVATAAANEFARRRLAWTDPLGGRRNASSAEWRGPVEISARRDPGHPAPAATRRRSPNTVENSRAGSAFNGQAAVPPGNSAALNESTPDAISGGYVTADGGTIANPEASTSFDSALAEFSGTTDRYSKVAADTRSHTRNARHFQRESISWSQAVDRLNELGIRTFRLTPDPGQTGYRFVCLVTSVDDPRISRRFEAESADPLVAVGRVLAQVENWNLHQ